MKALLIFLALFACTGYARTSAPFTQDGITIIPPVTQEQNKQTYTITHFNDGGTELIKITDARNKKFDVYIDHRIGTRTPGAIYLIDYPGKPRSVLVRDKRDFLQKIRLLK